MFIFHNSGHEEFIKLILLLFCFVQRLSLSCDTQKRENVVTRFNSKDLINLSAYWGFEIASYANRELPLLTKFFLMKIVVAQHITKFTYDLSTG